MSKVIPVCFSSIVLDSPSQDIILGDFSGSHLKVGAFSKFGNRNGSYITEKVAEQLIQSATSGDTPVVGFFDPGGQTWASHTGPTLANGYGYVESFEGWRPLLDSDGVTRDYAIFNVVLFTKYFEEAKKILGQNQSMELDPSSISGQWGIIDGQEYYIYDAAKIMGLCVIGSHEPCFSASSFFSKQDDEYTKRFEEFSSLLNEIKQQVEEMNNAKGGELPMEPENVVTTPEMQQPEQPVTPVIDVAAFEALQAQFDELQNNFNELQTNYEAAQTRINEFEAAQNEANTELETLRTQNAELQASVAQYEAVVAENENNRKNSLMDQYSAILSAEDVEEINANIASFSYDELKSKLAITFAEKQLANNSNQKVPLPETPKSQFALLMEKYRKN